jgi:hypothetical protein
MFLFFQDSNQILFIYYFKKNKFLYQFYFLNFKYIFDDRKSFHMELHVLCYKIIKNQDYSEIKFI